MIEGLIAALNVCKKQLDIFLSPEYATNQPWGSAHERFGVFACIDAIEELIDNAPTQLPRNEASLSAANATDSQ